MKMPKKVLLVLIENLNQENEQLLDRCLDLETSLKTEKRLSKNNQRKIQRLFNKMICYRDLKRQFKRDLLDVFSQRDNLHSENIVLSRTIDNQKDSINELCNQHNSKDFEIQELKKELGTNRFPWRDRQSYIDEIELNRKQNEASELLIERLNLRINNLEHSNNRNYGNFKSVTLDLESTKTQLVQKKLEIINLEDDLFTTIFKYKVLSFFLVACIFVSLILHAL